MIYILLEFIIRYCCICRDCSEDP